MKIVSRHLFLHKMLDLRTSLSLQYICTPLEGVFLVCGKSQFSKMNAYVFLQKSVIVWLRHMLMLG